MSMADRMPHDTKQSPPATEYPPGRFLGKDVLPVWLILPHRPMT